jgi:hypothetical protein
MTVFTAFHTTSTLGSITLFMTSLIDATGLYGGAATAGGGAGAGAEQPASSDVATNIMAAAAA